MPYKKSFIKKKSYKKSMIKNSVIKKLLILGVEGQVCSSSAQPGSGLEPGRGGKFREDRNPAGRCTTSLTIFLTLLDDLAGLGSRGGLGYGLGQAGRVGGSSLRFSCQSRPSLCYSHMFLAVLQQLEPLSGEWWPLVFFQQN